MLSVAAWAKWRSWATPYPSSRLSDRQFDTRTSAFVAVLFLLLVLFFVARVTSTYHVFNEVIDENLHIKAGLQYLQDGRYEFEAKHPPLARVAVAFLPYYIAGLRVPAGHKFLSWLWAGSDLDYYWKTLALARTGTLVFGVILLFFTYRWTSRLFGRKAGLAACLLLSCSPTVIAHSSLATLDLAAAATTVAAAYYFWRWSIEPSWRASLLAGLWTALAWSCKFSTVAFLPPIAIAFLTLARLDRWRASSVFQRESIRLAFGRALAFGVVVSCIIFGIYLFEVGPVELPGEPHDQDSSLLSSRTAQTLSSTTLPAPRFWSGLLDVLRHNKGKVWNYYLLGEISDTGWWYYFPVALAVKTTLPFLFLFLSSLAVILFRFPSAPKRVVAFVVAPSIIVLGLGMISNINLGIRHILPIYPFMAMTVAGVYFSDKHRLPVRAASLLLIYCLVGWHVAESAIAHPDYLAYFNETARGREHEFLADSNLDWGQDMARLGRYVREQGIESVALYCFCYPSPELFGIPTEQATGRPPEIAAVSTHLLLGLGYDDDSRYRHLRKRTPFARIGKSIWLFRLDEPTVRHGGSRTQGEK